MSARFTVRSRRKDYTRSFGVIAVQIYRQVDQRLRDLKRWPELGDFKHEVDQLVRRAKHIAFCLQEARECWMGRNPRRHFSMRRHLRQAQKLLHTFGRSSLTGRERVIQACLNVTALRQEFDVLSKLCDELSQRWEEEGQPWQPVARRCSRGKREWYRTMHSS